MSFLFEYLIFLAEVVTIVVALLVIISSVASLSLRQHGDADAGHLSVTKLNDRFRNLRHVMESNLLPHDAVKKQHKQEAKVENQAQKAQAVALKRASKEAKAGKSEGVTPAAEDSAAQKAADLEGDGEGDADGTEAGDSGSLVSAASGDGTAEDEGRVYVLDFEGDVSASHLEFLRLEVSAVLTMATAADEVVVCVESPGGMVHSYGLAASQLTRIRNAGIPLTVVVDKVAASGGYLMAAVANKVLAAPFALIGSIGVVAQIPNVHRLLKKNDVDVEVITAGKYKRTLTLMGENTNEAREKFVEEIEDVHALFQEFVSENRPELDIAAVATGEAWYGKRALGLGLVDGLSTSDEYLMSLCDTREVYEVNWIEHKKPIDKLLGRVSGLLEQTSSTLEMWRR